MHGPCGEILAFCFVGLWEGCAGACFDFASVRHSCTESCDLCCSNNSSCCSFGCSFQKGSTRQLNDLAQQRTPERRPLLEGSSSSRITAQPQSHPSMKA
ncbi:hypothetical protein F5880DRAFT_1048474 [Lentinula raphanica]|nr:hypothetical protein F5880DRAFT_1048474 [Lentinula raphanica]